MLALLCFCVATEFSVNKDLYKCCTAASPRMYVLPTPPPPLSGVRIVLLDIKGGYTKRLIISLLLTLGATSGVGDGHNCVH